MEGGAKAGAKWCQIARQLTHRIVTKTSHKEKKVTAKTVTP